MRKVIIVHVYLALLGLSWKELAFSVRGFVAIRTRPQRLFLFHIGMPTWLSVGLKKE